MAIDETSNVSQLETGTAQRGPTILGTGRARFRRESFKPQLAIKRSVTEQVDIGSTSSKQSTPAANLKEGKGPNGASPVFILPSFDRVPPREVKLQEWEGQVQEVLENHFIARLVDLTAGRREETEEVELPLEDITESDRDLLVPGAVFRWIIGHRYVDGQKEGFTRITIRRLPIWTDLEIKKADAEATALYGSLFGNRGNRAAETASD